jgi:hypothetical protein
MVSRLGTDAEAAWPICFAAVIRLACPFWPLNHFTVPFLACFTPGAKIQCGFFVSGSARDCITAITRSVCAGSCRCGAIRISQNALPVLASDDVRRIAHCSSDRSRFQCNATAMCSLPPKVFEPVRRQRRVDRGAGDRPMSEPALDRPGVVAIVGQRVGAHVGVGGPPASGGAAPCRCQPTPFNYRGTDFWECRA